ncbi:MAG: HAD-IIIA family hydrolase [Nanobdellota archaeon]
MVKCIYFDLDSVLYIYTGFIDKAVFECSKEMVKRGLKANHNTALCKLKQIRAVDPNSPNHFDELCYHFNGCYDEVIIASGIEKYWELKTRLIKPVYGSKKLLKQLKDSGYMLTIITNGVPVKQAGKLVKMGIDSFFYNPHRNGKSFNFYASLDKKKAKPKKYLWDLAKNDLNVGFSNSVMVGDRLFADIFGAKRLGMKTILLEQGPHAGEMPLEVYKEKKYELKKMGVTKDEFFKLTHPDFVIRDIRDIFSVLKKL